MNAIMDLPKHATIEQLVDWCVDELNKFDMTITMTEQKKWFRREYWRGHNDFVAGLLATFLTRNEIKERLTKEAFGRYFE